jgi:hypothetical protein
VAKNYYFENYENSMEQSLVEDLVIESIRIYGVDCYYIPKFKQVREERLLVGASGQASIANNQVQSISILGNGSGYLQAPTITITGGGGNGATAEAVLTRGLVSAINVTNPGSGYISTPTVSIQSSVEVNTALGQNRFKDGGYDDLLNEDDLPVFDTALEVEMYIKSVDGFEGEGDFLSKFGLQIKDSMTLTVAMRTWEQEIGSKVEDQRVRPYEGDLIYFPLNKKIFEIMHVEHEAIFYQMGSLQTYDLRCELHEFSNERFTTGIPEIDEVYEDYITAIDATGASVVPEAADIDVVDNLADNAPIETIGDNILDFSEENPFGESNF